MRIEIIDQSTLTNFVSQHPYAHHMKTHHWGEFLRGGRTQILYYGLYDPQLAATAMVIEQTAFGRKYWYIPFGPCVDYNDEGLLVKVLQTIKKESIKHNVFFVRIDPNQERREHTQSGEVVEDGYNYEAIAATIEQCGFEHLGYCYGYSGNWQPRFTYRLNIASPIEELIKNSYKENQTYLRKNTRRSITVRHGTEDELKYLETFGIELATKLGFAYKTKEYFAEIMHHYKDNHLYLLAEANLQQACLNIQEDIQALSLQVEQLQGKVRNQGRIKEITREINNLSEELLQIEEWQQAAGGTVVLGAGLFVYVGCHSFDLFMYSQKGLTNFRSPISIHYAAMDLLQQRGVTEYDFVGISGSLDRNDLYYGLYDFKRRFNGRFIEYLGEFDLVNHRLLYKLFHFTYHWMRRMQRKITRMRNRQ